MDDETPYLECDDESGHDDHEWSDEFGSDWYCPGKDQEA